MNEVQYFRMQEDIAMGQAIGENVKSIFGAYGADTMASLQRSLYKSTEAGVAISFKLHDDSYVYVGDPKAREIKDPSLWVRAIGVSSIVEGSDAEVPLTWIDL